MRQIPVKQAQAELKRLVKVKNNQRVTLLTNKKDRSLTITRTNGQLTLTEQGYINQTVTYPTSVAKHQLMAAFKREFPRSHQLYISHEQL
jgi:uncharacterized membrane-anchored protein YitT (DUF2179 family)